MEISIIKNDRELKAMSKRLNAFLDAHAEDLEHLNPEDAEKMELMCLVIKAYEDKRYPLPEVSPIDFIKFMMEQKGLKVKDIAAFYLISGLDNFAGLTVDFLYGKIIFVCILVYGADDTVYSIYSVITFDQHRSVSIDNSSES